MAFGTLNFASPRYRSGFCMRDATGRERMPAFKAGEDGFRNVKFLIPSLLLRVLHIGKNPRVTQAIEHRVYSFNER